MDTISWGAEDIGLWAMVFLSLWLYSPSQDPELLVIQAYCMSGNKEFTLLRCFTFHRKQS
jgi:hypothetical protein